MLLIPWKISLSGIFLIPAVMCIDCLCHLSPVYFFGPNGGIFTWRLNLFVLGAGSQHQRWTNHVEWFMFLCSSGNQPRAGLQLWPHPCLAFPSTVSCLPYPFVSWENSHNKSLTEETLSQALLLGSPTSHYGLASQTWAWSSEPDHCLASWQQVEYS